ncbi:hypothetical protein GDO81_005032 [Engystomops pustulosus]|uniref:Uncharacterized protein n=1 Tax=Engystomops pustulosus TaxID=76066 RepID=A0AAV7CL76_ENGPU|nr:hypothetical protein GDO81_005032 [Engystomops pustulosus]
MIMALHIVFFQICVALISLPIHILALLGLWDRIAKRYLPYLLNKVTKNYNKYMKDHKKELFSNLSEFKGPDGELKVLDLGCGTGANFQFYPSGCKGGAFYFMEHVTADPSSWNYFFQIILDPTWKYIGDGCKLTKKTWKYLERSKFSDVKYKHVLAPFKWSPVRPHIYGHALK